MAPLDGSQCLLANRGFFSDALGTQAAATGAALVSRFRQDLRLPVLAPCADGSDRHRLYPTRTARRRAQERVDVRAITYTLAPPPAPADELAAPYHERWEMEQIFDEFKTHPRGLRVVRRSKTPGVTGVCRRQHLGPPVWDGRPCPVVDGRRRHPPQRARWYTTRSSVAGTAGRRPGSGTGARNRANT
ncbi:MAG: hypothetical protein M0Z54_13310 [Thermaerobacter sp.]|nr:hypothetical protein [Thermaerobacter sp.]